MTDLVPAQPRLADREIDRFFFNKSLQQQGLEWRAGEISRDIRSDIRRVGAAIVQQQERAAVRYGEQAAQIAGEVGALRKQEAANAEKLQEAVAASAQLLRQGMERNEQAIERMGAALSDQLTSVRWELAQQHATLKGIFEVLRNSRSNECRQLLEQGDANLRAGYLDDARERYTLASAQDNTNTLVWQQLGLIAVQAGALPDAEAHFKKALAFAPPEHPRLRAAAATHLARLYYATERWREAEHALETAVGDDPNGAKNWYDLAVVRAAQGDAAGTIDALRRAIALDGTFYGLALSDGELDAVRPAVEQTLIVDLPRELAGQLAEARAQFHAFIRRIETIEAEVAATFLKAHDIARAEALVTMPAPDHVPMLHAFVGQAQGQLRGVQTMVKDAARKEAERADHFLETLPWKHADARPHALDLRYGLEMELKKQLLWKLKGAGARRREAERIAEERIPALRDEHHASQVRERDDATARALRLRQISNGLWDECVASL